MSAVCKQIWNIESTVDITNMTPRAIELAFRQARGDVINEKIKQYRLDMIAQNKTNEFRFVSMVDITNQQLIRYREFENSDFVQEYGAWYTNSCGTVFPDTGTAQFTLIKYEVLDDTTLEQITP
jgi:hypothetical protein